MSDRSKAQLLTENKRLRAEIERLDRIVNPPPPEPSEEPAPKPRLYVLALSDLEKRIVPNAFQMPEAIKNVAPDADWVPLYRLSDLPRDGYAVTVAEYVNAGFGRGPREIKWYRRKGRRLVFSPTQKQVERFREVSEPLIAAMGEAVDDATEYSNTRRGHAACALADVLHAQFDLALARFKAGELEYVDQVEDVLRKVPEQRQQISELSEDREHS
jgi:hypothetical protein